MAKTGRGKEKNAAKAQAEVAAEQVKKGMEALALIQQKTLVALLKADDNYKRDIDSLTGELREAIGNAKDKKQLDPKAYALLKRFHREKSNEKLSNLWHTLLAYMDMAGVMERINSVSALPLDGDADDDASDDETETKEAGDPGAEVVKPQFGGRRAPASTH